MACSAGDSPCRSPASRSPTTASFYKRAEAAGYTDLWSGETNGPDGFSPLLLGAAWTEKVRLGTGVVGVMQRGRALLAQEAAAAADASRGRFALGARVYERLDACVNGEMCGPVR